MGYEVTTDRAGNVIAARDDVPARGAVCVVAHLDTVFPHGTDLTVRRVGSRLVGPGIGDNGRGLATMLAIAGAVMRHGLRTRRPLVFAATTGEEGTGDLRGARRFFTGAGADAAAAIIVDGGGDDRIVHRALGSRRLRATFRGAGGHSWAAFGTANAIHAAAIAAATLARVPLPREPRTTLSVGRIGGGMTVNTIPHAAWFEVDVRSGDAAALARVEAAVRASCDAATQEENARRAPGTPSLACTLELIGDRPCGEVPADHPLVDLAIDATTLIGRDAALSIASTDANIPISLGIPAVAIGGGGLGGDAHTPGEWYDNTHGPMGLARVLTLTCAAAGLTP